MKRSNLFIFSVVFGMVLVLAGAGAPRAGASLDFGWGPPLQVTQGKLKAEKIYLAWPIQISNHTPKRWGPDLDIVAVTDTGFQYKPVPELKVSARHSGQGPEPLTALQSTLFPPATRRAVAVFEDVDPKASIIYFYVGGLVQDASGNSDNGVYLRITYKHTLSGWNWEGMSLLE